jgi:hypothetical protein
MKRFPGIVLATALIPLTLPGCRGKDAEAQDFNDAIVAADRKVAKSVEDFARAAGTAFVDEAREAAGTALLGSLGNDVKAVDTKYEALQNTLQAVRNEMSALPVPADPVARELFDAHQKYLGAIDTLVETDLKELATVVKDTRAPIAERQARADDLLQKVKEAGKAETATLRAAQRKYAEEHHLTLP